VETVHIKGGNSISSIKDVVDRMKDHKKLSVESEMDKAVKQAKAATDPKLSPAERHADWASYSH
jgi:hypothetical protein